MPLKKYRIFFPFQASNITWGKGLGCDFATLSCMELMKRDEAEAGGLADRKYPFCSSIMGGNAR